MAEKNALKRYVRAHIQHVPYREALKVSKGDVATLEVELYGWDRPATITGTLRAADVTLKGTRADGESYEYTASTASGTTMTFEIDEDMTGFAGRGAAELRIQPAWMTGKTIYTANFDVDVELDDTEADIRGGKTLAITSNGRYDMIAYRYADVNLALPSGKKTITENGSDINVYNYATVDVEVPEPEGEIEITENGRYNVGPYLVADVFMPAPAGKITIVSNGTNIDVSQYEYADVNVPGIIPFGTRTITENGNGIDVETVKYVDVNVAPDYDDLLAGRLTEITTQTSTLGFYALYYQDELTTINAPNLSILQAHALESCHSMTSLTIPVGGGWISDSALNKCYHFTDLYLPGDEMTELDNVNAFYETTLDVAGGGTGTIHVKASLENTYKNATNWSYYAQRIVGDL